MKVMLGSGAAAAALFLGPVAGAKALPACAATQLRLSTDGKDGQFDGMQQSGTELSVRNMGRDCILPALPRIEFLDARGRSVGASRAIPVGMHPGPVMVPVRLTGGHRAITNLTWVSGPVFAQNRKVPFRYLRMSIGSGVLRTQIIGTIYTQPGKNAMFRQPPLRTTEGMAAG